VKGHAETVTDFHFVRHFVELVDLKEVILDLSDVKSAPLAPFLETINDLVEEVLIEDQYLQDLFPQNSRLGALIWLTGKTCAEFSLPLHVDVFVLKTTYTPMMHVIRVTVDKLVRLQMLSPDKALVQYSPTVEYAPNGGIGLLNLGLGKMDWARAKHGIDDKALQHQFRAFDCFDETRVIRVQSTITGMPCVSACAKISSVDTSDLHSVDHVPTPLPDLRCSLGHRRTRGRRRCRRCRRRCAPLP
jgi:hypothetical protein